MQHYTHLINGKASVQLMYITQDDEEKSDEEGKETSNKTCAEGHWSPAAAVVTGGPNCSN